MKKLILTLLVLQLTLVGTAQSKVSDSYSETRKALAAMKREGSNKELQKLFSEADKRLPDLIKALDDPAEDVNLNA
jgi:hypothetical protein